MATALDLINGALRLINVLAAGETLDSGSSNDALSAFNDMVDSWNADRLTIFTTQSDDFPVAQGKQTYTMGAGGDFNIPRPARIDAMSSILLNDPNNPVEVPISLYSVEDWQLRVPVKNVTGTFPLICYDDGSFPLRKLNFWPIPINDENKVRIYSWTPLTQPAALNTTIAYPPGYARAFRYNLALELAPEYQAPVSAEVRGIALASLTTLKTMNAPDMTLNSDLLPQPVGYNYRADLFGMGF